MTSDKLDEMEVVFEDEDFVVVNKPYGMVVNRALSVKSVTIQDWMEERSDIRNQISESSSYEEKLFIDRSGMVHRLDKDTSGVMVLAKNPETMMELMRQFKEREVEKEYLALVHGSLQPEHGSLKVPIGRDRRNRKTFTVKLGGKMTETEYWVVEKKSSESRGYGDGFSMVRLKPRTGRTHQLRVVLKHLGHTIVGDGKYLGRKRARLDKDWCQRQFLHAWKLSFVPPKSKKRVEFKASLAEDLKLALEFVGMESRVVEQNEENI